MVKLLCSAPSPLAAAEVLCSNVSQHCHLFKWVMVRGEWQRNNSRRDWLGLYTLCHAPDDKLSNLLSCFRPLAPDGSGGALQRWHL